MCDESTQEQQSQGTQQQAQASTTTYTPSPQEQEMQKLQLENYKEMSPYQQALQKQGYGFINQLLAGSSQLPGFFGNVGEGINEAQTSAMSRRAVEDLLPGFQKSGIMDSGVAASVAGRVAGDIRNANAQYNVGNKLALLNLALSGSTQLQQPYLAQQGMLNQSLAGLRSVSTSGTTSGSTTGYQYGLLTPSFSDTFRNYGTGFGQATTMFQPR